jgi:RNA polymerase sigma-70 factor (ECF subfamily)
VTLALDDPRDDHALLAAHVAGDGDAFGVLVQRHRSRLWAVAVRTLRDPEDAADALQDALISAYRGAASFRGDSAVTTWLHRVVVNACLDRLRRAKARPTVPLPEHHDPVATRDEHAGTEARLDVMGALAQLPETHRAAIVLVDLQELSVAEAAQVLGVAEGTVKSRCSRGRAMLAQILRPTGPDAPVASDADPGNRPPPARVPPPNAPEPATGGTAAGAGPPGPDA